MIPYYTKTWTWVLCLLVMAGCGSTEYSIEGDSSLTTLDGRMLYLRVNANEMQMCDLDSCKVVHGKFTFMGAVDSICLGRLFMDNRSMLPIVLENGPINVVLNDMEQHVIGGELNRRLYQFIDEMRRLDRMIRELTDREAHAILEGLGTERDREAFRVKCEKLGERKEDIETRFVVSNSDNVLGLSCFMDICNQYPYPILTPQIKRILSKSKKSLRQHPYVVRYVRLAETRNYYLGY